MSEGKPFYFSGELFDLDEIFQDRSAVQGLFEEAFNETLRRHAVMCPEYCAWLNSNGFVSFQSKYKPLDIPPLPVAVLREFNLKSVPERLIKYDLGPVSNIYSHRMNSHVLLEARSCKRILKLLNKLKTALNILPEKEKHNYICFSEPSNESEPSVLNYVTDLLNESTAHRSVYYALKRSFNSSSSDFDEEFLLKKYNDFAERHEPLAIIGSFSYLKKFLEILVDSDVRAKLKSIDSIFCLLPSDKDYSEEYDFLEEDFSELVGLRKGQLRKVLCLIPQIMPYVTCEEGNFHIPAFSEVYALDPENLQPVEWGNPGMMCSVMPYLTSYPAFHLLSEVKIEIKDKCSCGRKGQCFSVKEIRSRERGYRD